MLKPLDLVGTFPYIISAVAKVFGVLVFFIYLTSTNSNRRKKEFYKKI